MKIPSTVTFADMSLRRAFERLEFGNLDERQLYKHISRALNEIEKDAFYGTRIPQRLIPHEYRAKYAIDNLWKYDLPRGWRLIYSVKGQKPIVFSIVLEWFSHKDYERRFGYKRS